MGLSADRSGERVGFPIGPLPRQMDLADIRFAYTQSYHLSQDLSRRTKAIRFNDHLRGLREWIFSALDNNPSIQTTLMRFFKQLSKDNQRVEKQEYRMHQEALLIPSDMTQGAELQLASGLFYDVNVLDKDGERKDFILLVGCIHRGMQNQKDQFGEANPYGLRYYPFRIGAWPAWGTTDQYLSPNRGVQDIQEFEPWIVNGDDPFYALWLAAKRNQGVAGESVPYFEDEQKKKKTFSDLLPIHLQSFVDHSGLFLPNTTLFPREQVPARHDAKNEDKIHVQLSTPPQIEQAIIQDSPEEKLKKAVEDFFAAIDLTELLQQTNQRDFEGQGEIGPLEGISIKQVGKHETIIAESEAAVVRKAPYEVTSGYNGYTINVKVSDEMFTIFVGFTTPEERRKKEQIYRRARTSAYEDLDMVEDDEFYKTGTKDKNGIPLYNRVGVAFGLGTIDINQGGFLEGNALRSISLILQGHQEYVPESISLNSEKGFLEERYNVIIERLESEDFRRMAKETIQKELVRIKHYLDYHRFVGTFQ